jgi:hypothetical protein
MTCFRCKGPLIKIDYYAARCPTCNRWQTQTDEWCRLAADDIVAFARSEISES